MKKFLNQKGNVIYNIKGEIISKDTVISLFTTFISAIIFSFGFFLINKLDRDLAFSNGDLSLISALAIVFFILLIIGCVFGIVFGITGFKLDKKVYSIIAIIFSLVFLISSILSLMLIAFQIIIGPIQL